MDLFAGRDTIEAEAAAYQHHKYVMWQIAWVESHKAKK